MTSGEPAVMVHREGTDQPWQTTIDLDQVSAEWAQRDLDDYLLRTVGGAV